MTTSTAKDAVMSPSRMGTMSTTCTTVTFIDDTTITTTNANRPATPCLRITTTSTAKDAVMSRSRMGTMSTTCTTGAGTRHTASTTTSTDAARPKEDVHRSLQGSIAMLFLAGWPHLLVVAGQVVFRR